MITRIKRWLGIDALERQNAARAEEILILTNRLALVLQAQEDINKLTSEPAKAKIEPKPPRPHRANWRTFRNAVENASESEQES